MSFGYTPNSLPEEDEAISSFLIPYEIPSDYLDPFRTDDETAPVPGVQRLR